MKANITELQSILDRVHNINSTAHIAIESENIDTNTWFERNILKYF